MGPSYGTARQRKERRQREAQERQNAYDALSMHDKVCRQNEFRGKQYRKLIKQLPVDSDGCYTLSNGDCVSVGPCIHTVKVA